MEDNIMNINTPEMFGSGFMIDFSLSDILLSIPAEIWWIIFFVAILLFGILTIVLIYHWNKYSFHSPAIYITQIIYIIGIIAVMVLAGSMLLIYNS
jgi:hypothetical protein